MLAKPPSIRAATHVALDMATAERLPRLGAANVVPASDRLVIGPSRADPAAHARARDAWWGSPVSETWDRLCSPRTRWEPPVALWVSASIHERVNLWRVLRWLRHLGIAGREVFILEFEPVPPSGPPEEPAAPFDCTSSVAHHPDEVLLARLAAARPWPRARYDRAVRLWERYVDPDPLPFVRSCLRGASGFPELAPLWAFLSSFFPRRTPGGATRLSRFDELLLSLLSPEWQTPLAMFVHESPAGAELRRLVSCTGDLFLDARLDRWAQHGPSPAVERAAGPKPPDQAMLSTVYRITESGARLREGGMKQPEEAPGLPIAGTEAYSQPWVLAGDGKLARL